MHCSAVPFPKISFNLPPDTWQQKSRDLHPFTQVSALAEMLPRFRLPQLSPDAGSCSYFHLPGRPRHHSTGFPPCQALTRSGPRSDPEASRKQQRSQTRRRLPWHASPGSDAQILRMPCLPDSQSHSRRPLPEGTLFRFSQDTPHRTRRPGSDNRRSKSVSGKHAERGSFPHALRQLVPCDVMNKLC